MKRVSRLAIACLLVAVVFCGSATAAERGTQSADTLRGLGLFQGTNAGDELERVPTRQEAVTMLVRLLGKEAEAKAGEWTTPFTDVPDWAKPYVGYAYANGLTAGTGTTTFGSAQPVDANQYASMVLRALGYASGKEKDFTWDRAALFAASIGLPAAQEASFLRGDVADLSLAALKQPQKDGGATLLERLVAGGVVDRKAAERTGLLAAIPDPVWEGTRLHVPWDISPQYLVNAVPEAYYGFMSEITDYDFSGPEFAQRGKSPGWIRSSGFASSFLHGVYFHWKDDMNAVNLREAQEPVDGRYFYAPGRVDVFEELKMSGEPLAYVHLPNGGVSSAYTQIHSYSYYVITDKSYKILGLMRGAGPEEDLWLETDISKETEYIGDEIEADMAFHMLESIASGNKEIPVMTFGKAIGMDDVYEIRPVLLDEATADMGTCKVTRTLIALQDKYLVEESVYDIFSPHYREEYTYTSQLEDAEPLIYRDGQWCHKTYQTAGHISIYILWGQNGNPIAYFAEEPES